MAQTDVLSGLSPDKLTEYVRLKEALVQLKNKDQCREDFMSFVKTVWPDFVMGKHHQIYAEKLQRIADGSLRRLIVNMPPRHTKSEQEPQAQDHPDHSHCRPLREIRSQGQESG
jgi:hypothetical protein